MLVHCEIDTCMPVSSGIPIGMLQVATTPVVTTCLLGSMYTVKRQRDEIETHVPNYRSTVNTLTRRATVVMWATLGHVVLGRGVEAHREAQNEERGRSKGGRGSFRV
jgi:hypothetical protein